ncbi:unnamed protein product [Musa acuminata subsp. malaccensis]|uniref:(wild Malaysian banana) hypothetical protein n=1 Tax=Musa acuminata subsp. malaccensis TaxID=214687 RepID=A0A804I6Q3_MUSAM|nr:unnamed protein product [Musa acuminata subsp. malaccensis]
MRESRKAINKTNPIHNDVLEDIIFLSLDQSSSKYSGYTVFILFIFFSSD